MKQVTPLKVELVRRGLVQLDVASQAGISDTRFSRLLNGRATMRNSERRAIAKVLGMTEQELPDTEPEPAYQTFVGENV